eukprot:6204130-Pleurochrysis_carterae.AAC.3
MATAASDDESVRLVIRSPMLKKGDLKLQVPLEASVAQIKSQIAEMLEEPTLPAEQRLIYAGRHACFCSASKGIQLRHRHPELFAFNALSSAEPVRRHSSIVGKLSMSKQGMGGFPPPNTNP